MPAPAAAGSSNFKNELRGCGPFLHDDPRDRPPDIFGGITTLHFGKGRAAYLLLPVIPPKAAGAVAKREARRHDAQIPPQNVRDTRMAQVEIVNRSTMIDKLHAGLVLRPRETAILTIDMHRGHLDPAVATMAAKPEDARRVIAAARRAARPRARARPAGGAHQARLPAHSRPRQRGHDAAVLARHPRASDTDRLTPGRASTVDGHNIMGSPGTEIIPELYREGDYVIDNKKRLARKRTRRDRASGPPTPLRTRTVRGWNARHPRELCSNGKGSEVCLDSERSAASTQRPSSAASRVPGAAAASTTPASTRAPTGARTGSAARRARAAASRAPAARSSARPSRRARAARASRAVRPERSPSRAPPESAVRREIWIAASPQIRTPTMSWLHSRRSSSEDSSASRARSGRPEPRHGPQDEGGRDSTHHRLSELGMSDHAELGAPVPAPRSRVKGRSGSAKNDRNSNCSGDQPFWAKRVG